jgi:hypothetical protein
VQNPTRYLLVINRRTIEEDLPQLCKIDQWFKREHRGQYPVGR